MSLGIRDLEIGTDFTLSYNNIFTSEIGRAAFNEKRGKNGPECCYRDIYGEFDVLLGE